MTSQGIFLKSNLSPPTHSLFLALSSPPSVPHIIPSSIFPYSPHFPSPLILFFSWTPRGYDEDLSLAPIAPLLSELLGITVPLVDDCVGPIVTEAVSKVRAVSTYLRNGKCFEVSRMRLKDTLRLVSMR